MKILLLALLLCAGCETEAQRRARAAAMFSPAQADAMSERVVELRKQMH